MKTLMKKNATAQATGKQHPPAERRVLYTSLYTCIRRVRLNKKTKPNTEHRVSRVTTPPAGRVKEYIYIYAEILALFHISAFIPASSGQAVVAGVVPSPPPVLAFNFYRA